MSADPNRVSKLRAQIAVVSGILGPETAFRLAGKPSFVHSTVFGRTGAAALRPIHARANSTASSSSQLNTGLFGALMR